MKNRRVKLKKYLIQLYWHRACLLRSRTCDFKNHKHRDDVLATCLIGRFRKMKKPMNLLKIP
jgi:hypothetical protein